MPGVVIHTTKGLGSDASTTKPTMTTGPIMNRSPASKSGPRGLIVIGEFGPYTWVLEFSVHGNFGRLLNGMWTGIVFLGHGWRTSSECLIS